MIQPTQCSSRDFGGLAGGLLGGVAGIAGAIAIDSAALSYERVNSWPTVGVAADRQSAMVTA